MEDNYTNLTLEARHLPTDNGGPFSSIQDAIAAGYDTLNPVTGIVEFGVVLDGAFIPLISEKASLVHDAIELAKANAAEGEQSQPQVPGAAVDTGPQAGVAPEQQSEQTVGTPDPGQPQG